MDLEDQNPACKSARDNGSNGSSSSKLDDVKGKGIEIKEDPVVVKSLPATTKGFGLKKWKRRARREARKDDGDDRSIDSDDKLLKRGLSNLVANSARPVHFPAGSIQKSDGSVSSTNAVFRSTGVDGFGVIGDLGLAIGPGFNAGAESENSEDRSSKSSTAASAPKARYEGPPVVLRSLSGKNLGNSAQQSQKGKAQAETSKKARGERVKIEKENSHSSLESDSRSSNFLFVQGGSYVTSNGTKSERPIFDGEFSDEVQDRERPIGEELRADLERENDRESENVSQAAESPWDVKEEKSENHGSSLDHDPLMESIFGLQAAQEAVEKELHKFKEIGKDDIFGHLLEDIGIPSDDSDIPRPSTSFNSLEFKVISLKQNAILLQSKLQKEEARVRELETILGSSMKKEEKGIIGIEDEMEGVFRQKIESEIQYLAISRTVQKLTAVAVDQEQIVHKVEDAEAKAAMIKKQAEKLESYCEDIANTDEKLKLQKKVFKYSLCFLIQLVLLAFVVGWFWMQVSPDDHTEVVPT